MGLLGRKSLTDGFWKWQSEESQKKKRKNDIIYSRLRGNVAANHFRQFGPVSFIRSLGFIAVDCFGRSGVIALLRTILCIVNAQCSINWLSGLNVAWETFWQTQTKHIEERQEQSVLGKTGRINTTEEGWNRTRKQIKTGDKEGRHQTEAKFLLQHLQQAQKLMLQKPPFFTDMADLTPPPQQANVNIPRALNSQKLSVLAEDSQAPNSQIFLLLRGYTGLLNMKSIWGWRQKVSLFASVNADFHSQQKKRKKTKDSHWIVTKHWPKISSLHRSEPLQGLHLISYIIRPCFTGPLGGVWSMAVRQHSSCEAPSLQCGPCSLCLI